MKRFFYHGTSADNLPHILKHGLSSNETKLWTCSQDGVYLWDSIALAKANDMDLEDIEWVESDAFKMANESGQIACCAAKDCRVIVVKVLIDDSEINNDFSCPNMEDSGACVVYRDITPDEIVEIKISNDLSLIKAYFISLIMDRDYCNIEFNTIEQKAAKAFRSSEIYPEDIDDIIEWESVELLQAVS